MDIDTNGRGIAQIDNSEPPTCECCGDVYTMETGDEPTPFCDRCAHDVLEKQTAELTEARATIATLTAEVEAMRAERDMWRSECESISAELDLPPGIRPAEGEFRRMLDHRRALIAERDEALASATIERTAANEWLAQLHDAHRERDEARGLLGEWVTEYRDDKCNCLPCRSARHLGGGK